MSKHKTKLKYILFFIGIIIFLYLKDCNSNNSDNVDCINNASYETGFASGSTAKIMNDQVGCYSYVEKLNYQVGRDVYNANECFCQGFRDGKNDKKKYK